MLEHLEIKKTENNEARIPIIKRLIKKRSLIKILCIILFFIITGIITLLADKFDRIDYQGFGSIWIAYLAISFYFFIGLIIFVPILLICYSWNKQLADNHKFFINFMRPNLMISCPI